MNSELVTLDNIKLGLKVRRNPSNWRKSWKNDNYGKGIIIGYINTEKNIIGKNANNKYEYLSKRSGPRWAAVRWNNGIESIYPIGAEQPLSAKWWAGGPCFSLQYCD